MLDIVTENPIRFGFNCIQFYFINAATRKMKVEAIAIKQIVGNRRHCVDAKSDRIPYIFGCITVVSISVENASTKC